MIRLLRPSGLGLPLIACSLSLWAAAAARAEVPAPVLHTVFPAGGRAGTSVTVAVDGGALDGLRDVRSTVPGLTARKGDASHFTLDIPAQTPPGVYDLRVVGIHGVSSPRAFFVGDLAECLETGANDSAETAQRVPLDVVVNGRIEKPGDVDCYQFAARAGRRVVLECWAERIDSPLRAVLEVYDAAGKRLAVNRAHAGVDPLIDFRVPADGTFVVRVFDLTCTGSPAHFYRLDIGTKPRVEFALPCVVQRGRSTRVRLFGRNLLPPGQTDKGGTSELDCVEVDVTPPAADRRGPIPLTLRPAQVALDAFAYHHPGGQAPVLIGVTDVPVVSAEGNQLPERAQEINTPCEVSGRLQGGDERHWYAVRARRGEVLWLEAFGERIGSPVDLAVAVLDPSGTRELANLPGCVENVGGYRFPTAHADPAGRWVAPADGRYLVLVRNRLGGLDGDPRRTYRLSVRREEPDFHLAVVSRRTDQPAGLNVGRGGREMAEVLAVRRRGLEGPIRVRAGPLPPGLHCPDVWIGPGQDRAPLVVTADRECPPFVGALALTGRADLGGAEVVRPAWAGTMVWPGRPVPSGRLAQEMALATGPEAGMVLTATPAATEVFQESALDVAVDVEQRAEGQTPAVHLTGIGLPRTAGNPTAVIAAGRTKRWISFFFPATLPPGPYTLAVRGETEIPVPSGPGGAKPGKAAVTLVSNPITVQVRPARIVLEIDPRTPRTIGRGKVIQIRYTAERTHGFLGKVHTELAAPGGVVGLRARGVTFVGQQDSGTIQVIATENAPLGRQPFLRLEAVGTVEDQPVFRGSRFVDLEITE
jgi:hypothetical protein